jgi:hypothetical protein
VAVEEGYEAGVVVEVERGGFGEGTVNLASDVGLWSLLGVKGNC